MYHISAAVYVLLCYIRLASGDSCVPCSDGQSLIANGRRAQIEDYPWHAGIYRQLPGVNNYTQDCGGSLISTKHVVTAAHCFWDSKSLKLKSKDLYRIVLGKYHRDWLTEDPGEKHFDVEDIIVQRQFRGRRGNFQYDIAIVRLKSYVVFSPHIKPVAVDWSNEYENVQLVTGKKGRLLGWGLTLEGTSSTELQSVELPYVSGDDCADSLGPNLQQLVTGDKFCAGYISKNTSACPGDSGGGLVFYHRATAKYYLRGVLSINFKPFDNQDRCYAQHYTAFTSVSDPLMLRWMEINTVHVSNHTVNNYTRYVDAGRYYRLVRSDAIWTNAREICSRDGPNTRLAVPRTKKQYKALGKMIRSEERKFFWVGISDLEQEGSFKTVSNEDMSSLEYIKWGDGEPNNDGQTGEDCVEFVGGEELNDEPCDFKQPFVCEYDI